MPDIKDNVIMAKTIYHGIILDLEFTESTYPNKFRIFAKRKSTSNLWAMYGIEVLGSEIDNVINDIQMNMKADKPYYAHFYNDEELIVVFKEKIFKETPSTSTWQNIVDYGISLGIPKEQLNFWPNRFQDEAQYFKQ